MDPVGSGVEEFELVVQSGFEQNTGSIRTLHENRSARFFHHDEILRAGLATLDFLEVVEFFGELLNAFFAGDALVAKGGDFIGRLGAFGKRRGHDCGFTQQKTTQARKLGSL